MNETRIEYLNYCWNFYPGCLNECSYCWAHKKAIRFNQGDFEPKLKPELLLDPLRLKQPAKIGVCFTGDLFGDWVDPEMEVESSLPSGIGVIKMSLKGWVFTAIKQCPRHTFLFLTKQPQNLIKWSPFPSNTYIGVSVTNQMQYNNAIKYLTMIEAPVKFLSFEPLLERIKLD